MSEMTSSSDSYNRGGFIAFIFSMAFSLLFFVYIIWIHEGVDLQEVPKDVPVEQTMAKSGDKGSADFDPNQVEQPWKSSPALIAYGEKIYKSNCAVCHGPGGKGDGPAGASLNPPPRDMVEGNWKKGGTSIVLYKTIANGVEGTSMAPFSHLPKTDRWALVHWIRSITKNAPEDDMAKLKKFAKSAE